MPIVLTFPLSQNLDHGHWGIPKGSTGRNGETLVGICLHVLESTIDTYQSYLKLSQNLSDVRPFAHGSVHYAIEVGGAIHQFVAVSNTAWAIQDLNNPTWTLLPAHVGINPNYLFISIGVEPFLSAHMPTLMFRALAELIAYLCDTYSITPDADHIIDHSQLDDTYADCAEGLATNLIATVTSLIAQLTGQVSYDVSIIAAQLAALTTRVTTLETNFAASLATIATFANHVTTKAGATTLGHVESSGTLSVNASTGVAATVQNAAAYKVDPTALQTIVPNISAILQFQTVISDPLAWATLGAFQKFTPTVAGLYRLRARIQFTAATWTAGKYIQVDVLKNSAFLETIAFRVIEANLTTKIVSLAGECTFVVTLTDYFDLRVLTDDSNSSKTIAVGSASIEKVGA